MVHCLEWWKCGKPNDWIKFLKSKNSFHLLSEHWTTLLHVNKSLLDKLDWQVAKGWTVHPLSAPPPSTHPICTRTLPSSFSPYLMQQIPEYPCSDCLLSLYHEIIPNNYGPDLTLTLFLLVFTSCLTILLYIQLQWQYLSFCFPLFGFITNCSFLLLQVSQSLLHSTRFIFIQDQFRNCWEISHIWLAYQVLTVQRLCWW